MITVTERARLARRQAELRQLAGLMRERAGLAPAPVPPPLHKMGTTARQTTATATGERQP